MLKLRTMAQRKKKSTENRTPLFSKVKNFISGLRKKGSTFFGKIGKVIERRPFLSFISLLIVLFLLIIVGDLFRKPKPEPKKEPVVKQVSVYRIGTAPKISLQGQVEKAGVIQITALMGGVVQNIPVTEGQEVGRGQNLISLSSNYQGGNALGVARQIAEKQYQNTQDTFQTQKDLVSKQRDQANVNRDNTEKLRKISEESKDDTQAIIDLNNEILTSINDSLSLPGLDNATIQTLKSSKSQLLSANLQLNTSLRNLDYQTNTDNPPTKLADLQRDITQKQLDIADKALDMSLEVSKLQLQAARINEATMYPSAPFNSVVQKVFARVGQAVSPGTPLFILSAKIDPPLTVNVYTSKEISEKVSKIEPTILHLGDKTIEAYPSFISTDAVSNNLYNVMYDIPQDLYGKVTDKGYVTADIPVGVANTNAALPFLPLDTIFQTQENSTVFVNDRGRAVSRNVTLGPVYGSFVEVEKGLEAGDEVILDRSVIEGDRVESVK